MLKAGTIKLSLKVGTTAGHSSSSNVIADDIKRTVEAEFEYYEFIPTQGRFEGEEEDSANINVIHNVPMRRAIQEIVKFCAKTERVVWSFFTQLNQKSIIVGVDINGPRGEFIASWNGLEIKRHDFIKNKVRIFPLPAVLAMRLVPQMVANNLSRPFRAASEKYRKRKTKTGVSTIDIPAVWFTDANCRQEFEFKNYKNLQIAMRGWREWDRNFVREGRLKHSTRLGHYMRYKSVISAFRAVSDHPCLYALNLGELLKTGRFPICTGKVKYDDGNACCEGRFLEAIGAMLIEESYQTKEMSSYFETTLKTLTDSPYPLLGFSVVMLLPGQKVIIKKRKDTLGAYPGNYHLAPSGMMENVKGYSGPSLIMNFLRELDEELFGGSDYGESVESLVAKPHIRNLRGTFSTLGFSVDLLRHSVAISCLFEPSRSWWNDFGGQMKMNWEFVDKALATVPLGKLIGDMQRNSSRFVPEACVGALLAQKNLSQRRVSH